MFLEADWLELISVVAEMVLQMRVDVKRDTHDWFQTLFRKGPLESVRNPEESFRLYEVIRKPMHAIRTKLSQQHSQSGMVPIGIDFSLVEKRTGKEMAYERWQFTFSRFQTVGSRLLRTKQIFQYLAYLYDTLISLPLWMEFLKRDQGDRLKHNAHFVNYEVAVGTADTRGFALQSIIHNTSIIDNAGKIKLRLSYSELDGLLVNSQFVSYSNQLQHLLSTSKKTIGKKQSTEDSEKSKDNTLSGAPFPNLKTRTTSLKLNRRLSAYHFDDSDQEVTFLSTAEDPNLRLEGNPHSKEEIILEDKKSSSEFEMLQNEHAEEAYEHFRQELERIKLTLQQGGEHLHPL